MNWIFGVGMVGWFGGAFILAFRAHMLWDAYLRRFKPVDGIPLNMYAPRWLPDARDAKEAYNNALWESQADPELERMRRQAWRRTRVVVLWGFGFPVMVAGVMALVIVTGVLH